MPDGVLQWFDPATGEGAVVRGGRVFTTSAPEIETVARHAGARVHFDVNHKGGTARAVNVTLRQGTRVSHRHRRFGTLAGARRPDTKGSAPFAHPRPELGLSLASHPLEVVAAWAGCLRDGDLDAALGLYAPDAHLHANDTTVSGRRDLHAALEASGLLGRPDPPELRGEDDTVVATWAPSGDAASGVEVRCRIGHGLLAEQWVGPLAPGGAGEGEGEGPAALQIAVRGPVGDEAVDYARLRLGTVLEQIGEPVLFARAKLTLTEDPARERPAIVQVAVDVDGDLVRAHVAGHELQEAVDLLQQRLRDQLGHRAARNRELRRSSGISSPGEWRHGDLPSSRPDYFDRPPDERQLVRHKTFAADELTPDEAAFDMEQLDYDFHLFRDLASGEDAVIERRPDGTFALTRLHPSDIEAGPTAVPLTVTRRSPPKATVPEAIELLEGEGAPFVFFVNPATDRGNVVYRRYDGHYGLLVPD